MSGDTPKKDVGKRGRKPRETNDISESDFFWKLSQLRRKQDTSARKTLVLEILEKKGVTKRRLADVIQQDLGLKLAENLSARARSALSLLKCETLHRCSFSLK